MLTLPVTDKALNIVGVDAIPIFVSLITTNFALLQCEGAQALYRLSAKGTANTYLTGIVFFEFRQF